MAEIIRRRPINVALDITSRRSVSGGVRYTNETKESIPDQYNTATPIIKWLPVQLYEAVFEKTTFSGSVSYRWSDELMTYASYSQGFKSGGFNSHFNDAQTQQALDNFRQFNDETADSWEFGFKADLLENALRLNGAYITTNYDDLQFIFRVGVASHLLNAGKASIDGFEAELTYAPNADFIVDASVGHLIDRFKDIIAVPLTTATVGPNNALPFTPAWSGHIGAAYTLRPFGGGVELSPRVNLAITSSQFFDAANTVEVAQNDTVVVLNTSVRLADPDRGWALVVGLNNATDELYPVAGNASLSTSTGYAESIYARPRNWFVELSVDF